MRIKAKTTPRASLTKYLDRWFRLENCKLWSMRERTSLVRAILSRTAKKFFSNEVKKSFPPRPQNSTCCARLLVHELNQRVPLLASQVRVVCAHLGAQSSLGCRPCFRSRESSFVNKVVVLAKTHDGTTVDLSHISNETVWNTFRGANFCLCLPVDSFQYRHRALQGYNRRCGDCPCAPICATCSRSETAKEDNSRRCSFGL